MADETTSTQTTAATVDPATVTNTAATTDTAAPVIPAYAEFTAKDLAMPEGVQADEALLTKFADYAKTVKLPKDQAQAIVSLQAEHLKAIVAEEKAKDDATYAKWDAEIKAIPNSAAVVDSAKKLIEQYIAQTNDEGVKTLFLGGDLLKHPGTVKMLASFAKRLSGDTMPEGSRTAPADAKVPKTTGERMYGGTTINLAPNPNTTEIK
jgi:hypothetical protein